MPSDLGSNLASQPRNFKQFSNKKKKQHELARFQSVRQFRNILLVFVYYFIVQSVATAVLNICGDIGKFATGRRRLLSVSHRPLQSTSMVVPFLLVKAACSALRARAFTSKGQDARPKETSSFRKPKQFFQTTVRNPLPPSPHKGGN